MKYIGFYLIASKPPEIFAFFKCFLTEINLNETSNILFFTICAITLLFFLDSIFFSI